MSNAVTYLQSPFNKARKDKFLLVFDVPPALKKISAKFNRDNNTIIPDTMQFSIFGGITPTIEIPAVDTRYSGQTLSQSSHTRSVYEPNTVSFTVDNRFNNYWVLYTWLNLLNDDKAGVYDKNNLTGNAVNNNPITPFYSNYEYQTDISIFALDEYEKRIVEFVYKRAFPTALGGISYSHRDEGEIETSFTFKYSQILVNLITSDIENF